MMMMINIIIMIIAVIDVLTIVVIIPEALHVHADARVAMLMCGAAAARDLSEHEHCGRRGRA
jgi:hypothetical protein